MKIGGDTEGRSPTMGSNTDDTYNGWTNRETWAANLWLSNEFHLYEEGNRRARAARSDLEAGESLVGLLREAADHAEGIARDVGSWWRINEEEIGEAWRVSAWDEVRHDVEADARTYARMLAEASAPNAHPYSTRNANRRRHHGIVRPWVHAGPTVTAEMMLEVVEILDGPDSWELFGPLGMFGTPELSGEYASYNAHDDGPTVADVLIGCGYEDDGSISHDRYPDIAEWWEEAAQDEFVQEIERIWRKALEQTEVAR